MAVMRSFVLAVTILLAAPTAADAAGVIVFTSGRDGARYDALHAVDSTGHSLRELQNGLSATSWTRSGNRVVLVEKKGETDELVVVDATGARTAFAVGVDVYNYEWSPSGNAIAFDTLPAHASRITVLDTGSGRTTDLGPGRYPAWSPDGRRVIRELETVDAPAPAVVAGIARRGGCDV